MEQRQIDFDKEVSSFAEVGAVGTAVVLSPIGSIEHNGTVHEFNKDFPVLRRLHDRLLRIQAGEEEDTRNWYVSYIFENKNVFCCILSLVLQDVFLKIFQI